MVRGTHAADHGLAGVNRLHAGQARTCPVAALPAGKKWLAGSLVGQALAGTEGGLPGADAGAVLGSYPRSGSSSSLSETAPRLSASLASRAPRWSTLVGTPNLSYRF